MANIAITGAAGNVGRVLLDGFDGHELTPLTFEAEPDIESRVLDVTECEAFVDALSGQDVLVHLAGNPSPRASDSVSLSPVYRSCDVSATRASTVASVVPFSSTTVTVVCSRLSAANGVER
jgi:putative NADH-flavin reductase